jgi:hypothetical protein
VPERDAASARRGPVRLDDDAVDAFLAGERLASLCFETDTGGLGALPVRVACSTRGAVRLVPPDVGACLDAAVREVPACLVADEFEDYEGIQGVIVQGVLGVTTSPPGNAGVLELRVSRRLGFTFAGTLPPALASADAALGTDAGASRRGTHAGTGTGPGQEVVR